MTLESGESWRNRQGEQIERDERIPEARKISEIKTRKGDVGHVPVVFSKGHPQTNLYKLLLQFTWPQNSWH